MFIKRRAIAVLVWICATVLFIVVFTALNKSAYDTIERRYEKYTTVSIGISEGKNDNLDLWGYHHEEIDRSFTAVGIGKAIFIVIYVVASIVCFYFCVTEAKPNQDLNKLNQDLNKLNQDITEKEEKPEE